MNVLKRFLLSFMLMLTCTLVYAQTEITGTVVDETGETVIGATVVEKGTSNGTVTDFDGNFVIKVNPGATFVVSSLGYEKMEVAAENGMTITLKFNGVELKDVVEVAYQVLPKADLTGAERKRVKLSMTRNSILSEETLMKRFPIAVSENLRLSTDRFDLGVMHPGETKERNVVVLHRDENDRTETLAISYTPDEKTPKGLQHIPYTVTTTEQGKPRQLTITFDVMIK